MTTENNDSTDRNSDAQTDDQLEERVAELEAVVEDLTSASTVEDEQGRTWSISALLTLGLSRREAMLALGALGTGASFAQALRHAVGVASANPDEKDVGTPDNPVDAYISNVYGPHGSVNFADPVSLGDVTLDKTFYYAADDSGLTDALSKANDGDTILLGGNSFTEARTISTKVSLRGSCGMGTGTTINGTDWTLNSRGVIQNVYIRDSTLTVNDSHTRITNSMVGVGGEISVQADDCVIMGVNSSGSAAVTFESGTAEGIVDASTGLSVTDNGSNTVGDIA